MPSSLCPDELIEAGNRVLAVDSDVTANWAGPWDVEAIQRCTEESFDVV
jgi:hypothetical protein